MNILGAIVAGTVATIVMTTIMMIAPQMGMPKMDIVGMLGSMFSRESNRPLGMALHLMMGGLSMMHAGVKAGVIEAPGMYMTNKGGMMAFVGGLIGHLVFGLVVALVYGLFV